MPETGFVPKESSLELAKRFGIPLPGVATIGNFLGDVSRDGIGDAIVQNTISPVTRAIDLFRGDFGSAFGGLSGFGGVFGGGSTDRNIFIPFNTSKSKFANLPNPIIAGRFRDLGVQVVNVQNSLSRSMGKFSKAMAAAGVPDKLRKNIYNQLRLKLLETNNPNRIGAPGVFFQQKVQEMVNMFARFEPVLRTHSTEARRAAAQEEKPPGRRKPGRRKPGEGLRLKLPDIKRKLPEFQGSRRKRPGFQGRRGIATKQSLLKAAKGITDKRFAPDLFPTGFIRKQPTSSRREALNEIE